MKDGEIKKMIPPHFINSKSGVKPNKSIPKRMLFLFI